MNYTSYAPHSFNSVYEMAQYYKMPIMNPEANFLADCPEGTVRENNYFKKCAGVVYLCRDACFDPVNNTYNGIGPWKSCGVCIGGPF